MRVSRASKLLLILFGLVAAACTSNAGASPSATAPGTTTGGTAAPSGTATGSAGAESIDRQFIDMMVPHHQSAIEMAELARERATHPELKGLADAIIADQEAEIGEMRDWRQEWFGSSETPPMTAMPMMPGISMPGMSPMPSGGMPGHSMGGDGQTMDMTADVERLRNADPFDAAFIDAMIAHHTMAIEAAEIVIAANARPEIKDLGQRIIESQQREIDQLTAWRAEWYPGS